MTAETAAETLAGMMYIPDGARVTVYEQITRHNSRPMMSYQVSVNHPYFDEHGYVVDFVYPLQFGGVPSCETIIIDQLYVNIGASGQGHGLQTLVDLVRFGVRDGAKSIRMKAEGYYDPPGMNPRAIYQDAGGATVWPRMGFDTYLHPFEEAIPAQFQHRGTLQSLLSTADGRAWWAENNFTLPLVFDLRGGSQSRQILRTYATERGYEAHGL